MTTTETFEKHRRTGLPVQPATTFEVGDLVTERLMSDGTPGVVVHATPKTVYVASVKYAVGNVQANDVPGWNGYGDSATLVVDPESVERAVEAGKDAGTTKYVLHVNHRPTDSYSLNEAERFGGAFHRAGWQTPGGGRYLTKGASYRRDPHV